MPKASTRFRTRKINFKSAISIYIGLQDNPFDEDFAAPSPGGLPGFGASAGAGSHSKGGKGENGETIRVETGVDKEEEGEHHLQAVISASAAALQRSGPDADPGAGASSKPLVAHIPTPDATGLVANYSDYYPHGAYTDPHCYIRYSDTVEETSGVAYTMDEDDEDFLIDHNIRAHKLAKLNRPNGTSPANGAKTPSSQPGSPVPDATIPAANDAAHDESLPLNDQPVIAIKGHYPPLQVISGIKASRASNKKAKEALISASVPVLSEDDFELVMDLFERITDRKVPTLHLDISRIPPLEDFEAAFVSYLPPGSLRAAKAIARIVYPHWKERRTRAGGKNIVPQLDYDETNETPYVCFRRREVKVARKTRRTDTQTIERLVRLKSDLASAQELLLKVLERERCKREVYLAEARIFESRVQMRELKRKLKESAGDESILVARREKRRRREDMSGQPGSGTKIVITSRASLAPLTPGLLPDPLPAYKDRTANATQRVDKDMQRKKEQELGWEDVTDTAFLSLPQMLSARLWRASERHILPAQDGRRPAQLVTFDPNNLPFTQTIGSRYRKRVGRGGRVHLDRLSARSLPKGLSQQLDENILARLEERWRYDTDVGQDLPAAREPLIFDDFDTRTSSARLSFTSLVDWESLLPSTTHVDEALRWTAKEPESLPPIQVIGKLPGQRIQPFVTGQNGQIQNLLPPNMANQLYAAASRAMNVTQAQAQNVAAQQIRRASSTAPKSPIQGQMQQQQQPQQSGPLMNPPQPFPIRRLMMENSA